MARRKLLGSSSTSTTSGLPGAGSSADPGCCCCSARRAIGVISAVIFLLGFGVALLGFFINERVQGWQMRSFNVLGWMCIGIGGFLLILAVLGFCTARGRNRLALILYFMMLLMMSSALLLISVYAVLENEKIGEYLEHNWEGLAEQSGATAIVGVDANAVSFEEVMQAVNNYLAAICGVGLAAVAMLLIALVAAMRLLGVRMIAMSFLAALALLGFVEVGVGLLTRGQVPKATTWLLLGCAGVQIVCSAAGICGFRRLNCECLFWSCIILLVSAAGLAYACAATYAWLMNAPVERPENLLLVFGITLVADFFMISTLVFMLVLYCKRRSAFMAANRAAEYTDGHRTRARGSELPVEFSNYSQRERPAGAAKRKRRLR